MLRITVAEIRSDFNDAIIAFTEAVLADLDFSLKLVVIRCTAKCFFEELDHIVR